MMPVDRFGKLFFPNNPANKYATPINRKPKRKKLFEHYLLPGFVVSLIAVLVILFIAAFVVTLTRQSSVPTRVTWYESFIHEGAGNTEVGPVDVTGTWRFTWSCPVTNKAMSLYVRDDQGNILLLRNVECTSSDHVGMATITYAGQPYIEISAVGSWTVSIEEPTQ